jgi:hypothetical protein
LKAFHVQLIGSKLKLNTKVLEDYNNNKKKPANKFNWEEESYSSEDQPDFNSFTKKKCKTGKLNSDQWA